MNEPAELITCCPRCNTSFRVTDEQLQMASGAVRCGACMQIFQATEQIVEAWEKVETASPAETIDVDEINIRYWLDWDQYIAESYIEPQRTVADDDPGQFLSATAGRFEEYQADDNNYPGENIILGGEPYDEIISDARPDVSYHDDGFDEGYYYEQADGSRPDLAEGSLYELAEGSFYEQAEGSLYELAEGSLYELAEGSFYEQAEGSFYEQAEGSLYEQAEGSLYELAEGSFYEQAEGSSEAANVELESRGTGFPEEVLGEGDNDQEAHRDPEEDAVALTEMASRLELESDPEFLVGDHVVHPVTPPVWYVAMMLLLMLGFLQFAWFNQGIYSQRIEYRPWYLGVCSWIGCEIPEYLNVGDLSTSNLVVRSHPEEEGGLIIDAIVRNSATYRQRFPVLQLQFLDIEDNPVAQRKFDPKEYLAGELRGLHFIPGNTEVRFSLEIVDPGENALGYSLRVVNQIP